MEKQALFYTAKELVQRGADDIPADFRTGNGLVYSSPATLSYNSPGAEGFGVKRAGLAIPGSVMLIVSPGCCGRNTSGLSELPRYRNRFFYLSLDDPDLVTGRHLVKIPQAVKEVVESLLEKPSVVMICVTCVDALLGTDMERVCKKAEEKAGVPVRPSYMYALTREGTRPPMVNIRQSIYSMLTMKKKNPRAVNLLGFFSPLLFDCELYTYLRTLGVQKIREIGSCADFDDFLQMAEANFNLVLFPEAREAAANLETRCQIPSIELSRFYDIERIRRQYRALFKVLGATLSDEAEYEAAKEAVRAVHKTQSAKAKCAGEVRNMPLTLSIGECANADPFELSAACISYGFSVAEIFGTLSPQSYVYLRHIAEKSPDTRVYFNQEPSMLYYTPEKKVDLTIGKDAGYWHFEAPCIPWNEDVQPYGYVGVRLLFEKIAKTIGGTCA